MGALNSPTCSTWALSVMQFENCQVPKIVRGEEEIQGFGERSSQMLWPPNIPISFNIYKLMAPDDQYFQTQIFLELQIHRSN